MSGHVEKTFLHPALHLDRPCIRILRLESRAATAEVIKGHLEIIDLDNVQVSFETLSYCWGRGSRTSNVICDGQSLAVTDNLSQALMNLRHENEERRLWVDAICINQDDLEERTAQVSLMGRVYREAAGVVVWLGLDPYDDNIDHVFRFAEENEKPSSVRITGRLRSTLAGLSTSQIATYSENESATKHVSKEDLAASTQPDPSASNLTVELMKGISAIVKREWWRRTWVIQELALPPKVLVTCGDLSIPWPQLHDGLTTLMAKVTERLSTSIETDDWQAHIELGSSALVSYSRILATRANEGEGLKRCEDLFELLQAHRWSSATDPRDKIYGMLGLAKAGHGIVPDYSISTAACYARTAFALIRSNGSLDVMRCLGWPHGISKTLHDLPTWAPDWSYDMESLPVDVQSVSNVFNPAVWDAWAASQRPTMKQDYPQPCATGTEKRRQYARLDSTGKILTLRGYVVDSIDVIGERMVYVFAASKSNETSLQSAKRRLKNWEAIGRVSNILRGWDAIAKGRSDVHRANDEAADEAFLVTVVQNRIPIKQDRVAHLNHLRSCFDTVVWRSRSHGLMALLGLPKWQPRLRHVVMGYKLDNRTSDDIGALIVAFLSLQWSIGQKAGSTRNGRLAMLPAGTQPGDCVALLDGGCKPFIVRKQDSRWEMVGECYVHGIMAGEAWAREQCVEMEFR